MGKWGLGCRGNLTYNSWANMKQRCNNPHNHKYKDYGGKGITYDPRWELFINFLEDMGERPKGTTLDRYPNKTGDYCKDNCRWATPIEQARNTKTFKDNYSPLPGVHWMKQSRGKFGGYWVAYPIQVKGKRKRLYHGPDLFEAICIRKPYENKL
jgi:hypothetical protein